MNSAPVNELMLEGLRENVFPGAVLLAGSGDVPIFYEAYGKADLFSGRSMTRETVFDLASLTKPLATTLAVARLVDLGRIDLDFPVAHWLTGLTGSDKAAVTARQLLSHQSGLPAHRRFYMALKSLPAPARKGAVLDLLKKVPLENPPGRKVVYSDLGFMLLCRLVEAVTGVSLCDFLKSEIYDPMGISDLFFVNLDAKGPMIRHGYAATELCPLRKRLLIGEVHDDNAWYAGGVDGHAGLFGTASAVFKLLRALAAGYRGQRSLFSRRIIGEIFHGTPGNPLPLGLDRPSAKNSSAGRSFSAQTVGHLGFTGVSFWWDLEKDVVIILLTNRVHPSRWNTRLQQFRPRIHDRVMEHFEI
jgi:CubicO group peptidase (beta-lactamase class C family)